MANSRFFYGWIVLIVSVLVVFGSLGLARFGYTLVLPSMQSGLGITNTEAGALATVNLIGYLILSVVGGILASHFGPRKVICTGLALSGCGMLLTGAAQNFFSVALWRGLAGIGSGASNVPVMGLLSSWFAKSKRGLATGIAATGSSVGLILLGPTVPRLLETFGNSGWRVCWFFFGGITILIALGAAIFLRNDPTEKGTSPLGESTVPIREPKINAASMKGYGGVYKAPTVLFMGLIYIAFGFSYIIYMTFFFKHLITEGGYSRDSAGNLFMLIGWLSLFCGVIWGTVSDRLGRKYTLAVVYLLQAAAFGLFGLWTTPFGFLTSAVLFGLTAWSIPAIMAAMCGDVLGPKMAPAALGYITLFFGIGQAIGPSVAGAIADLTGSFNQAFLLAGVVALLGGIGSLFLRS